MANVAPADLAKEFRSMLMRVARQLTEDEMTRISYEEGFTLEAPPGSSGVQDMIVHFLHKLEAKGVFSPRNPDGFATLLKRLPRGDLVVEVNRYKQHPLFLQATKKPKDKAKDKGKKKNAKNDKKNPTKNTGILTDNTHESLEDMFAIAMTHACSLMAVLEDLQELMQLPTARDKLAEVTPQVKEAITMLSKEEHTVAAICQSMRKVIAESGTNPPSKEKSNTKNQAISKGVISKQTEISSDTTPSRLGKKLPLLPPTDRQQTWAIHSKAGPPTPPSGLGSPLDGPPAQKTEDTYNDIVTMTTLKEAYSTYDCVRPHPKEENIYYNVAADSASPVRDDHYEDIEDTPVVTENEYATVRFQDSGVGTGGAEVREWTPKPPQLNNTDIAEQEDLDGLVDNPMYEQAPTTERSYMGLLSGTTNITDEGYTDLRTSNT